MKTVCMIDGGAGRAIAAIPALIKYSKKNKDFRVLVAGWDTYTGVFQNYMIKYSIQIKKVPLSNSLWMLTGLSLQNHTEFQATTNKKSLLLKLLIT